MCHQYEVISLNQRPGQRFIAALFITPWNKSTNIWERQINNRILKMFTATEGQNSDECIHVDNI